MTTGSSPFFKRAARPAAFALTVFVFSVGGLSCDELLQEKGAYLLELNDRIAAVEKENAALNREVAALSSPRRISRIAEEELGMVRAGEKDRVCTVSSDAPKTAETEKTETERGGLYAAVTRLLHGDETARP